MTALDSTPQEKNKQLAEISAFLDCIFGEIEKGEEIPFWTSVSKIPGFPKDEEAFLRSIRRSRTEKACYFGTSTMRRDEKGTLYNRQALFAGFYLIVLDDIGTGLGSKLTPQKVPELLRSLVTYRIETSPNNEQWGFALDHPIRDLELAKAFQREIISRSGADSGGLMVNKLVRMPLGVNLKDKYREDGGPLFECRLLEFNPGRWTPPAELLDKIDAGITWDQLQEKTAAGLGARRTGTTVHRKSPAYQVSLQGVVDPVLEWLNESGQIVSERGEWVDIICPWAEEHTEGGGNTAGYAPIGIGSEPDRRGFHCFHDACRTHRTGDFLAWVLESGGPRSSPKSPVEALVARYAFDQESNRVFDLISNSLSWCPYAGFKNQHVTPVFIPDKDGRMKTVSEFALYMTDPNRLRLAGVEHLPGGAQLLPDSSGWYPRLNMWRLPGWGAGDFDEKQIEPFLEFIHYLIPKEEDAEWFLDHLAAKAQDPLYRGPGIIMATPLEKTGRGTLATIIEQLWGIHNTATISLSKLLAGAEASDNNSWAVRDWLFVAEAKETDMSAKREFTAYESLKKFIDSAGVKLLIKEKWAVDQHVICHGCTMLFTQHSNVIPTDSGATRFRRIENTVEPWGMAKFNPLYEWIEGGFEPHLWRWLRARDISHFDLRARQEPLSLAEETRRALESARAVDAAIGLCILFAEAHNHGIVFVEQFTAYLVHISEPLGLIHVNGWIRPLRRELMNKTRELIQPSGKRWRPQFGGKSVKIRSTTQPVGITLNRAVSMQRSGDTELMREAAGIDMVGLEDRFLKYCRAAIGDAE